MEERKLCKRCRRVYTVPKIVVWTGARYGVCPDCLAELLNRKYPIVPESLGMKALLLCLDNWNPRADGTVRIGRQIIQPTDNPTRKRRERTMKIRKLNLKKENGK